MILGVGATVIYQERVWTVAAQPADLPGHQLLRSLDGQHEAVVIVEALTEAP